VCTGVGIGPTLIDRVWGITKAYTTRVGAGPFPTKLEDEEGDRLRDAGAEFGATTGRPRDCGWLDLPALRHAARLNGLTGLCVTKIDVLARLPRVRLCTRYRDGVQPGLHELDQAVPELEEVPGWGAPDLYEAVRAARTREALPAPVRAYLARIEEAVGVPVVLVSLGAEREETVRFEDAF
jgi:adenylosuccinate synthase